MPCKYQQIGKDDKGNIICYRCGPKGEFYGKEMLKLCTDEYECYEEVDCDKCQHRWERGYCFQCIHGDKTNYYKEVEPCKP